MIEGSGSISQKHGSEDPDPDPHQNVMDPQHCRVVFKIFDGSHLKKKRVGGAGGGEWAWRGCVVPPLPDDRVAGAPALHQGHQATVLPHQPLDQPQGRTAPRQAAGHLLWQVDTQVFLVLRIRDVYPGSWFLPIPDPRSRIQKQLQKIEVKKICCHTFFCSHKFHKI